jgi:hypothetical protein
MIDRALTVSETKRTVSCTGPLDLVPSCLLSSHTMVVSLVPEALGLDHQINVMIPQMFILAVSPTAATVHEVRRNPN